VKKEVRIEVETPEKMRVCSGRRGIRKWGREPLGPWERAQKIFEKKFFFEKRV